MRWEAYRVFGGELSIMKILFVNKAYFPHLGGVETVVRQLAEGMQKRGHDVAVLCFAERGDARKTEIIGGVEIHRVRPMGHIGSAPFGYRFITEFFRLLEWADAVNFHSPNPMGEIALLLSSSFGRKKILCTYHGDAQRPRFLLPAYDAVLRRFFRRCDIVAVSNPPLSENSRVLRSGFPKEKTRIITFGVRVRNYKNHTPSDLDEARRLLSSLPPSSFKVMFAGRMVYYKGIEILLEALRTLGAMGHLVSAYLIGSGPREGDIKTLAAQKALGSDVLLILPHQPEGIYRALFSLADCFVLPSTHETEAFGVVLAEAMASGLPLVSTELGTGTSWINRDGETGIVIPSRDPDALARAVARIADSAEERNRMAAASRARAENFFDEETMLDAYDEIFRREQDSPPPCHIST